MLKTQEERESQLQQLQDVLFSAWEALGVQEGEADRRALAPLLRGPERLHASTKEMVSVCKCCAYSAAGLVVSVLAS